MRLESGKTYHIFNRGNNRENIFKSEKNYQFFLERFNKYLKDHVDVLAYCLMPNHFHFLVRIKEYQDTTVNPYSLTKVEKAFRDFFISYAKAINKMYDRTGSLFQYKFKRKEVLDEDYFSWLVYYIHANPIKSGLAKEFSQWNYSSYNAILRSEDELVNTEELIRWFGAKDQFVKFHRNNLNSLRFDEPRF